MRLKSGRIGPDHVSDFPGKSVLSGFFEFLGDSKPKLLKKTPTPSVFQKDNNEALVIGFVIGFMLSTPKSRKTKAIEKYWIIVTSRVFNWIIYDYSNYCIGHELLNFSGLLTGHKVAG